MISNALRLFLKRSAHCGCPHAAPVNRVCLLCALALAFCLSGSFSPVPAGAQGAGPKLPHPGFRTIGIWAPDKNLRMDVAVWYPSSRAPRDVTLEGWNLRVSQNGAAVPGRYPVILLSHDAGASRFASHDLAAALARHGFMVIAPTHPGDNADETRKFFHAALFAERPSHLLSALDAVEQSAHLRPFMDRSRIGALGVGAGAATALQLAGARPDLALLNGYCTPETNGDPLCSNWAKLFHARMKEEFAVLVMREPGQFTPRIGKRAEPRSGNDVLENPVLLPVSQTPPPAETVPAAGVPSPPAEAVRIEEGAPEEPAPEIQPLLAVGLLTPGLTGLFPDAELRILTTPVGILAGQHDTVYVPARSVDRMQALFPRRPTTRVLQNANHYDLQVPCPPAYRESFDALCGSQSSGAEDFRRIRNDFFIRFFQKTLGRPAEPPLPFN